MVANCVKKYEQGREQLSSEEGDFEALLKKMLCYHKTSVLAVSKLIL
jgi:hypothetical protein